MGRGSTNLEATRIRTRKRKAIRTERITIDLAEIIAHLPGARVRVFELQNRLRDLASHLADLDGAAVVGGEVGLGVGAGFGCEFVDGAAGGDAAVVFALAADVDVYGEGAVVAHVGLARGAGCGVDVCDWGTAGDDRGVGHGCRIGIVGWGWGGGDEISHG